ncbi:YHS domain-containing protein, partial [Pseudomonas sp. MD195_PC81_125]
MPNISSHHDHSHAHAAPLNDDDLRDPVCGMAVTSSSKFGESYQGQKYQFCSLKCQEKFRADPERFSSNVSSAESRVTTPEPAVQTGTEFTCPMHPEIRQPGPGNCPKCGMTLEPVIPALDEEENPELRDFARRFWWSLPLTVIVTLLAMAGHTLQLFHGPIQNWIELALATPVTLWAGWPFF